MKIVNGTGRSIDFIEASKGFTQTNFKTLKAGEASILEQLDSTNITIRDSHSKRNLKYTQQQDSIIVTNKGIVTDNNGSPISLQIKNNSISAIEICELAGPSIDNPKNYKHLGYLIPDEELKITGKTQTVYIAKAQISGRVVQTFISGDQNSQAFNINLQSRSSDISCNINISNKSTLSLVVQWIDFDKTLRKTTALKPGNALDFKSFLSHPWVLRDAHSGLVVDAVIGDYKNTNHIFTTDQLRSVGAGKETVVEFWNASAKTVNLATKDFNGNEKVITGLNPGARRYQTTKVGQVWEAYDFETGKKIVTFLPKKANVQTCNIIPRDENLHLPPEVIFENKSGLLLDLVAKDASGEEQIFRSLPHNGVHHQPTTTAERWYMRDHESGRTIEELVVTQENFSHQILASKISSIAMDEEVEAEFVNTTPFYTEVFWMDYDGKEEYFYELKPGESIKQATHATHVWRIREKETKNVLKLYIAKNAPKEKVEINIRPIHSRENAKLKFRNYTGLTTEIIWFNADGKPKILRTLIPGRSAIFNTYSTHAWAIRDKVSGTVLKTITAKPGNNTLELNNFDIRSKRSDRSTKLIFKNKMPFSVDIHWIDYEGKETPHETLLSGERLEKDSYTTHPYRFRHHITKREVGVFLPKEDARQQVNMSLLAYEDRIQTFVEIRNMTSLTANVFRVDKKGKETFVFTLNPRDGKKLETYSTHPVIVRDKISNEPIAFTIASNKPQLLEVDGSTLRSNRTEYPVWLTWKNTLKLPVDIFWVKYDGTEEKMKTLAANQTFRISSFPSHVWRARFKSAGTEVDLYITGKEDEQTRNIGTNPPLRTKERANGLLWPGEVALYDEPNFGGKVWIAHGDLPDFNILSGFNDTIASIKVAPNTAVSVFEDAYFNALPQDRKFMAGPVESFIESSFKEALSSFKTNMTNSINKIKEENEQKINSQIDIVKSTIDNFVNNAPKQLAYMCKRFISGGHVNKSEKLSKIDLQHGQKDFEDLLKSIIRPSELIEDRNKFAEMIQTVIKETNAAIEVGLDKELEGNLDSEVIKSLEEPKKYFKQYLDVASNSALPGIKSLVQKPESDVFHVDDLDLEDNDIQRDRISSIRVLRNMAPERLRISSTNKVADDPQIVSGKIIKRPVYRTTIKFPPEVKQIQVWGTENTEIEVSGITHKVGPKDDEFARIRPNPGGTLVLQVSPDKIGVPPLMIRTNSMPANARVFIFPDADVHRKFAKMDDKAFVHGVPDKLAPGGIRKLEAKAHAKSSDLEAAQKAIQTLSSTSSASIINNATGSAKDRKLVVGKMDMSAFQLDFGGTQVSDQSFRPVDPESILADAQNAEDLGQGFFDVLEDIGEGVVSVGAAVVDVFEDGVEWVEQAAVDTAEFFEDTAKAVAEGFEDLGKALEEGFEAIGDAFEDAGEWVVNAVEDGIEFIGDVIEEATEVLEDIGSAIASAAEAVVDGVSKGLQLVIKTAGQVFTIVVDTLEKVGEVITYVAKKVVEAVEKVVDFICALFSWNDILKIHDSLSSLIDDGFGVIDSGIVDMNNKTSEFIGTARSTVKSMMSDARKSLGVDDIKQEEDDDKSDAMDALMWIFDKITALGEGASSVVSSAKGAVMEEAGIEVKSFGPTIDIPVELQNEIRSVGQIFTNLLMGTTDEALDAGNDALNSIGTRLGDILKDPGRAPQLLAALFLDMGEILIDTGLSIAELVLDAFFNLARVLIKLIKVVINAKIEIPFITEFYALITGGRDLTIKSVACLLLAIPATIIGKLTFGNEEFMKSNLSQDLQPENKNLFNYGVCHIILGIIEPIRDGLNLKVKSIDEREYEPGDWSGIWDGVDILINMTIETFFAVLSGIVSTAAIVFSGPYSQASTLSKTAWSMQIVELILDLLEEVIGWYNSNEKNAKAINALFAMFNVSAGIIHLILNLTLLWGTDKEYHKEGSGKHLLATGYFFTTFPTILGGVNNIEKMPGILRALLVVGRSVSHFVEGGTMMALAHDRNSK